MGMMVSELRIKIRWISSNGRFCRRKCENVASAADAAVVLHPHRHPHPPAIAFLARFFSAHFSPFLFLFNSNLHCWLGERRCASEWVSSSLHSADPFCLALPCLAMWRGLPFLFYIFFVQLRNATHFLFSRPLSAGLPLTPCLLNFNWTWNSSLRSLLLANSAQWNFGFSLFRCSDERERKGRREEKRKFDANQALATVKKKKENISREEKSFERSGFDCVRILPIQIN